MKILEKITDRAKNASDVNVPCIAFLGDSVTQGCFELHEPVKGKPLETVYDSENNYQNKLKKIFELFCPKATVAIINAGISGDNAQNGAKRAEKDILRFNPDLVVVSYGLNDSHRGIDGIDDYKKALSTIFKKVKESGAECIFMTENMMNTYVSDRLTNEFLRELAEKSMSIENDGVLEKYFDAAKEVAAQCGVAVCDVYSKWKKLNTFNIDITDLLSNSINHPVREMHWLFAYSLFETMLNN